MLLTKSEIVDRLRSIVAERGGTMHNVGGDCYALVVSDEIRIAVAVKELAKQEKSLWIGLPNPIVSLVAGQRSVRDLAAPSPYRAFIVASHILYKTLLVIPVVPVALDLSRRATAGRVPMRDEFDVKMIGYKKYVIQGEELKGDVPIRNVDTFEPIERILELPRSDFEDASE
jgi:hypothetical protein